MSNRKNILFRADSSSTIGTGHIMRDLVLAEQFEDANIIFATQDLSGNINYKIEEKNYTLEILRSNDIVEVDRLIDKYYIDMVVIDHYGIDCEYEKKLKERNRNLKIFVFDDTYEKHYCDILLNHNVYANEKIYNDKKLVPEGCEIRCGSQYTLIRDEFVREKKRRREKIYDFFVAMGGADSLNITAKILKLLPEDKNTVVITTKANAHLIDLEKYVESQTNIDLFVDSANIAKLLNSSKFAIVTPSVIVHEVLYLDVPFLAIKTAENQKHMVEYLDGRGYLYLDRFNASLLRNYTSNSKEKK